ncbi:hypothetical protein DFH08DRAFT_819886 [Mycena albidolilacea]|uniref:Uncharacterized protein n=1 Tax=Mycena albidolilacea TaxID=1033008 RepID=A0AAD7EEQ3_9AGAR|nr:hypothetical protein DFH08DRAFT_819886 [Mycena albidolilacea]
MTNPKPTSYADRAAVTSDRVTRAAKRASSVPTSDPAAPTAATPAAETTTTPLPTVAETAAAPPDSSTTLMAAVFAPAPIAVAATAIPAPATTAAVTPVTAAVPIVAPTLVPVASAVVAALDAARAKTAAPAAKASVPATKAVIAPTAKAAATSAKPAAVPTSAAAAPVAPAATTESVAAPASTHASTVPPQCLVVTTPLCTTQATPAASCPVAPPTPATPAPTLVVPAATSTSRARSPGPDFPPTPNSSGAPPKSHEQKRKEKGKAKAKGKPRTISTAFQATHTALVPCAPSPISPTPSPTHSDDEDFLGDGCTSYDLDADLNRALTMSVGQPTNMDTGALSSRRAIARLLVDSSTRDAPASPPKRLCDDREGREEAQECCDPELRDAQERRRPEHRPTFNRYPPAYNTRDGNPPQGSFVPHRPLLTRAVYGMTGGVLFRNHPTGQLRQWNEVPQLKVVATISGGNGDRIQTAEQVRANLAGRFNLPPEELLIGTPGLAERNGPDPIAWLIAGFSVVHAQTLINIGCLCSDTLTMFFHEYQPQITGFVGTFYGFTIPESNAALAHRTIVAATVADPAIARFIRAHCDTFPVDPTAEECLVRFGEHIDTVVINLLSPRGPFVAWNVYIRPPTTDEDVFAELLGLFRLLVINTPFHGQGRIYPCPLHCNICLSIDHPTNLCLLPSVPGWLGPTPETIGTLLDATREVLNPRTKRPGNRPRDDTNNKGKGKGPGKGKDRDDRKGGDRRRGN